MDYRLRYSYQRMMSVPSKETFDEACIENVTMVSLVDIHTSISLIILL